MDNSNPNNVQVCVRFRPMNETEAHGRCQNCVRFHEDGASFSIGYSDDAMDEFSFDQVFHEYATQTDVYEDMAYPLVGDFVSGINCCLLAFGEAGSGKTHTLVGDISTQLDSSASCVSSLDSCGASEAHHRYIQRVKMKQNNPHQQKHQQQHKHAFALETPYNPKHRVLSNKSLRDGGRIDESSQFEPSSGGFFDNGNGSSLPNEGDQSGIIPRLIQDIFTHINSRPADVSITLYCSLVDIYMDNILDLLEPNKSLCTREDAMGNIYIEGAAEELVPNEKVMLELLERGSEQKSAYYAGTDADSSRSHTVLMLRAEQTNFMTRVTVNSLFYMVDLARSELVTKNQLSGQSRREANTVSRSLSTLGNVILAMSQHRSDAPYGDSKLTTLLQDAIDEKSKLTMIITASPFSSNLEETMSVIHFGKTAKWGVGTQIANEEAIVDTYRDELGANDESQDKLIQVMEQMEGEMNKIRTPGESIRSLSSKGESIRSTSTHRSKPLSTMIPEGSEVVGDNIETQNQNSSILSQNEDLISQCLKSLSQLSDTKQTKEDLTVAREELVTVSTLLRSAAKRMEADLSSVKSELMSNMSNPEQEAAQYEQLTKLIDEKLNSARKELRSVISGLSSGGKSFGNTAKQVEADLIDAQKALRDFSISNAHQNGDNVRSDTVTTTDWSLGSNALNPSNRETSVVNSQQGLPKKDPMTAEMDIDLAELKKENIALARDKKMIDEELIRAKREIKMLSLRLNEAEHSLQRRQDHAMFHDSNPNDQFGMGSRMGRVLKEDNVGVSNIVSSRYGDENDVLSNVQSRCIAEENSILSGDNESIVCGKIPEAVRVCLRLRPMSKLETSRRSRCCVEVHDGSTSFTVDSPLDGEYDFNYDQVFDVDVTQPVVYNCVGAPLVSSILAGINCCIIAYGLSSSGKTNTLMGQLPQTKENEDAECDTGSAKENAGYNTGITPRLVKDLFLGMLGCSTTTEFCVRCSYVAIYLEKIYDLLQPQNEKNLFVKEVAKGVQIEGASEACCFKESDVTALIQRGIAVLSVMSSRLDIDSSRAHSIFIMKVEQRNLNNNRTKISTLYLADLAGSEMTVKSKGQTVQETKIVHKSFSALGNVIKALSEGNMHAPYRESKLTSALKDAFGGNCRTTLIVTASPSSYNISETINAIRLGQRAREVINMPRVNQEVPVDEYRKWLMTSEIKQAELVAFINETAAEVLKMENAARRNGNVNHLSPSSILSGPLWESVQAIVNEEENLYNPIRKAMRLGNMDDLCKAGLKWQCISLEIATMLPSEEFATVIKARDRAESLLADIQSEIVVLRRQNDLLVQDKKTKDEELISSRKEVKLLTLRKSEVEHKLGITQYREKEAIMFLRHLRKLCWRLQKDTTKNTSTDISEITSSISGAPDLSGLVDIDCLLLEAGLIEKREILADDDDSIGDIYPSEDILINATADADHGDLNYVSFPSERARDFEDNQGTLEGQYMAQSNQNAVVKVPFFRPGKLLKPAGIMTKIADGPWPFQHGKKKLLGAPCEKSAALAACLSSTPRERQLERDLRTVASKCVELQMLLNDEKATIDMLTNRNGSLSQKRLTQEAIALRKEKDRMMHNAKAATWKLQELHVVNKVLDKKAQESKQHVTFLEEGFQRLQETFRATALDSFEGDSQLREQINGLQSMVDALTVPDRQRADRDVLSSHVNHMNLCIRGRLQWKKHTKELLGSNASKFPARFLLQVPSLKLPEKSLSLCKRRLSKYRRRSKKTGDSFGGLKKMYLEALSRRRPDLIKFEGSWDTFREL